MWNPSLPLVSIEDAPARLGAGNPELQAMVHEAASGGTPLMLMHVDIDHFASVNENMSAEVGDQALVLIAQRLQHHLRGRGKLWRHGSDEFLIAVPRTGDLPLPDDLAEEIRQQLELPLSVLPMAGVVLFTAFEVFVSFLQAYVFTLLTGVYINAAQSHEH